MTGARGGYSQERLLTDGRVRFDGFDRADLLAKAEREPGVTRLKHPEVRYEVTDSCNAACSCARATSMSTAASTGIMGLDEYKKRIDKVVRLGGRKIVLAGFGEPLIDKTLEQKSAYAKQYGLNAYIISNASLLTRKRAAALHGGVRDLPRREGVRRRDPAWLTPSG